MKYLLRWKKTSIYLRYVKDILILTNDINEIKILQDIFQKIQLLILPMDLTKTMKFPY